MHYSTFAIPDTRDVFRPGIPVIGADGGTLGTFDAVLRSATTGKPQAILVRHGRVRRKYKQVRAFEIRDIQPDRVIVGFDDREFHLLPDVEY